MVDLARRAAQLAHALLSGRTDLAAFPTAVDDHLEAALAWILEARAQSSDGGIPAYYDLLRGRWRRSYPETTGYMIPTLLACATRLDRPTLRPRALDLANYLLAVRTPEGGVGHWDDRRGSSGQPIVFDTGQVIFGWLAAWRETLDTVYLDAATRAADWLVEVQDPSGAWTRYQHLGVVKVIDTRVALALVELGRLTDNAAYVAAARRNLRWALGYQAPNGWFEQASFRLHEDPYTHALAYTAEGLMECGLALEEPAYIAAATLLADALLERQRADGSLASTFASDWQASSSSSCLTGNCQIALLWLRCFEHTGRFAFRTAAQRAIAFVGSTQLLRTADPWLRGGIAGSYPIYGPYERMKYPNWAAKFFVDAILAWRDVTARAASAA
jgi:hypothetical protein